MRFVRAVGRVVEGLHADEVAELRVGIAELAVC